MPQTLQLIVRRTGEKNKVYCAFSCIYLVELTGMPLLGMPQAGARLGLSSDSTRRALLNAGVPLVRINARAWAVEESDLAQFAQTRTGYAGRGRPVGTKNKQEATTQ